MPREVGDCVIRGQGGASVSPAVVEDDGMVDDVAHGTEERTRAIHGPMDEHDRCAMTVATDTEIDPLDQTETLQWVRGRG